MPPEVTNTRQSDLAHSWPVAHITEGPVSECQPTLASLWVQVKMHIPGLVPRNSDSVGPRGPQICIFKEAALSDSDGPLMTLREKLGSVFPKLPRWYESCRGHCQAYSFLATPLEILTWEFWVGALAICLLSKCLRCGSEDVLRLDPDLSSGTCDSQVWPVSPNLYGVQSHPHSLWFIIF